MKKKLFILTVGTVLINVLMLLLFDFSPLKVIVSCLVIVTCSLSLYILKTGRFRPAFKYGLGLMMPFFGILEYVVSLIMPAAIKGNWGVPIIVFLWLFQWLLLSVARHVSAKISTPGHSRAKR